MPGCALAVIVPISTKPKPSASHAGSAMAFLSIPAARPIGLGKSMPKTLLRFATQRPCERSGAARLAEDGKAAAEPNGAPSRHPAGREAAGESRCRNSLSNAERAEDFSEDFFDIRCADNFTRGVKSFSQRHCDQFGIGLFLKFFLGFLQAQIGRVQGKLGVAR